MSRFSAKERDGGREIMGETGSNVVLCSWASSMARRSSRRMGEPARVSSIRRVSSGTRSGGDNRPVVRVHGPRVTVVQQRTRCRSMKADPVDKGLEATSQGASVSSDRSAQGEGVRERDQANRRRTGHRPPLPDRRPTARSRGSPARRASWGGPPPARGPASRGRAAGPLPLRWPGPWRGRRPPRWRHQRRPPRPRARLPLREGVVKGA
jgi:hypothetical protein